MDLRYIVLGIVQGIAEWLPVSSKTAILLISAYIYGYSLTLSYDIGLAIQGGTVISSAAYFWRSLARVFSEKWLLKFLATSTIVTGIVGVPLYLVTRRLLEGSVDPGIPTTILGVALIAQALISRRMFIADSGGKVADNMSLKDSLLFGLSQGFASLPGVSRSGATITVLLYLGYRVDDALRLSFIASIPANLGALATILLFDREILIAISLEDILLSFLVSAVIGYLAIKVLIRLASKYRSIFTLAMGLFTTLLGLVITIKMI